MIISKHELWNLPTKITFFFYLIYLFNVVFYKILSYFAKPNFIVYDEWFDDDLEKTKNVLEKKRNKNHFKYSWIFLSSIQLQSWSSENNLKLDFDIKVNDKIITNNYFEKTTKKLNSISNRKLFYLRKLSKRKLNFNIPNKLIYSLSIFSFIFIFGFLIFFSEYKKNDSDISNSFLTLERKF